VSAARIERSVGDRYDNAVAETVNDLYPAELVCKLGPWQSIEALELETLNWVTWLKQSRLLAPIGNIPPAEFEAIYEHGREDYRKAA
jgi:transposase InsO family protein